MSMQIDVNAIIGNVEMPFTKETKTVNGPTNITYGGCVTAFCGMDNIEKGYVTFGGPSQ